MRFQYKSGFTLEEDKTNSSPQYIYYSSGSVYNKETGEIHIFFKGKVIKKEGFNYIFLDDEGLIYNSQIITSDCPLLSVSINDEFQLEASYNPTSVRIITGYNTTFTELIEQMEEISTTVDDIASNTISEFKEEMDLRLAEALAVDPYQDTVLEVFTETGIVDGNIFSTVEIIKNVLGIYVINSGELELNSINSIDGRDIIFSDNSLNSYYIEISYNALKNT